MSADRDPTRAFLSLGGNVGDTLAVLVSAIWSLDDADGLDVVDVSGVYETAPWGGVEQAPFLNLVAVVDTSLEPLDLLATCQAIEAAHGRDRSAEERWGPRTLDVDILLHGDAVMDTRHLTLPHPRLHERAFVLVPLMEVMPGGQLPDGRRVAALLAGLAPLDGIELVVRLEDLPGAHAPRPEGPSGPAAIMADEWAARRPGGAPDGVYR